jgi:hypothetical protein
MRVNQRNCKTQSGFLVSRALPDRSPILYRNFAREFYTKANGVKEVGNQRKWKPKVCLNKTMRTHHAVKSVGIDNGEQLATDDGNRGGRDANVSKRQAESAIILSA